MDQPDGGPVNAAGSTAPTEAIVQVPTLVNYLRDVVCLLIGGSEGELADELKKPQAEKDLLKFAEDTNVAVLSVSRPIKEKDEEEEKDDEAKEQENKHLPFVVSLEVAFSSPRFSSVTFIKRGLVLTQDKDLASQLRVITLSEGQPYETLHSFIHCAINPYLNAVVSYQKAGDKLGIKAVKKAVGDFELSLLHLQQDIDIPEITLVVNPTVKQVMQEAIDAGRKPSVEDFGSRADDATFLNALTKCVARWIREIQKVTRLERDPSSGTAMQEVSFWLNLERALLSIKDKRDSPEVTMTLEVLKLGKRFHATVGFDSDTGLQKALESVSNYNQLMKDFPLNGLLSATDTSAIRVAIVDIFSHMKRIRNTRYPVARALKLVQAISRDLTEQLLKVLAGSGLMQVNFSEFERIVKGCEKVFAAWEEEDDRFRNILRDLLKKKRDEAIKAFRRVPPEHKTLQDRLNELSTFRKQHEQLRTVIVRVLKTTSSDSDSDLMEAEDINAIQEVNLAYEDAKQADVLDLSETGIKTWEAAKRRYEERIDRVETRITSRLRDQLGTAKNANEMFRIFGKFNALFVRPKIRGAIREYQAQLIQRVKADIEKLHEKFKVQYNKTQNAQMSEVRDIPPVSGQIIWARQIDRQLTAYLRRVEDVLGRTWENHVEGRHLKEDGDSFRAKLDTQALFDKWSADVQARQLGVTGRIFDIDRTHGAEPKLFLTVNFHPQIITLSKEVRNLKWMGFRVPLVIVNKALQANHLYPFAISLKASIRTYQQTIDKLAPHKDLAQLVASYHKNIQTRITEGVGLRWESYRLEAFVQGLAEDVFAFQEKVDEMLVSSRVVEKAVAELDKCPMKFDSFADVIGRIQKVIDDLNLRSYVNLDHYVESIDARVEAKLTKRLSAALHNWSTSLLDYGKEVADWDQPEDEDAAGGADGAAAGRPEITPLVHEISIRNQVMYLNPPAERAREKLLEQLQMHLANITALPRIQSSRYQVGMDLSETEKSQQTYRSLLTKLPGGSAELLKTYGIVESYLSAMQQYVQVWLRYQALWDMQTDTILTRLGDDMSKWRDLLVEIKRARKTFDTSETSKSFGPITINYAQVQSRVNMKYDALHKDILGKFGAKLGSAITDFFGTVQKARNDLESQSIETASTSEAVNFITILQEHRRKVKKWSDDVESFHSGQKILERQRYAFPPEWVYVSNIESEWENFKEILARKNASIQGQVGTLQLKVAEEDRQLEKRVADLLSEWDRNKPVGGDINPDQAVNTLAIYESRFVRAKEEHDSLAKAKNALDLDFKVDDRLEPRLEELRDLKSSWSELSRIWANINEIKSVSWSAVQPRRIRASLDDLVNQMKNLPPRVRTYASYEHTLSTVKDYIKANAMLLQLKSDALKERHWKTLMRNLGVSWILSDLTLGQVWEADLVRNKKAIEDVMLVAQGENALEEFLKQIREDWSAYQLDLISYQSKTHLIRGWDALFDKVKEHINSLAQMKMSHHYKVFEEEANAWDDKLNRVNALFDVWIEVQRKWVYLEGIFSGSAEIKQMLPTETSRFESICSEFLALMSKVSKAPMVLDVIQIPNAQRSLERLADLLAKIQKALGDYLERERSSFPRFYFVGNEDLLDIIGNSKNVERLQKHFKNMFAGVQSILLNEEHTECLGLCSREGEEVVFRTPVQIKDVKINTWLLALEKEMKVTLAKLLAEAVEGIERFRLQGFELEGFLEWLDTYQAQLVVLAAQVSWSQSVEVALRAIESGGDKTKLEAVVTSIVNTLSGLADTVLLHQPPVRRKKLEHMITELVHQRDVTRELVAHRVSSVTDFRWQSVMRFYFNPKQPDVLEQLTIEMADAQFHYGFEYLGLIDKLVQTPLTDRCYLTMTQALKARQGGSPFGPAGTGKTESVKALGNQLGRFVLVFNCDETFDMLAMGRIFVGLCQVGAWGCFDEFNRIELPVLSVAAQQIAIVLTAKKERKQNFLFMDGDDVSLDPEFGLFLTMNPGYAGRQELPENLKIQFRSVAMMVPDRQIIIRVKLASCGFQNNVILARKFYTLYKLCEEQLTKQVHYDFGLRNILSVLRTLGAEKRKHPEDGEMTTVMRVLRDMNLSKLVDEDEPLFLSLIGDLFPGIQLETAEYPELQAAIAKNVDDQGLVNHPAWNLKLVQLYETQLVRHGFMVLGPSGAGKTCNITTLMRAMTDTGTPHREMRMNPKAITAPQMFGRLDVATNDWTDGIFSTLWRRTLKAKKGEKTWIVLDGPVDAVWIENLNSVLDDNKMLTLANGDRIPMSPDAKLVFEPHNIDNASPATVSRNGMVFMSSSVLDWKPILEGWLKQRPAPEAETLRELFEGSFDALHQYVKTSLDAKMSLLECNYVRQALDLLQGLIPRGEGVKPPTRDHLARLYVFALMWSLGAVLELSDRAKLQEQMIKLGSALDLPKLRKDIEDSIFDYLVGEDGAWLHWSARVGTFEYPTDSVPLFRSILVPNVDNTRTDFLIDTIAKQRKAVLLIGEPGTAKTVIIKGYCSRYEQEEQVFKSLNFSSTTHPNGFQRTMESYVEKRMGTTFGPPGGKKMTVFVDDINMPIINEWGDQIANEIVRQVMNERGFYSLDKPGDFTTLADLQYMAAMAHPGGGRNDIPQRLKRQFNVFNCTLPSNASIDVIFRTIGCGYFCTARGFKKEVADTVAQLVPITRKLWQDVKVKMLPTPAKFHYVFNLRDVSRIWEGMLIAPAESVPNLSVLLALWQHECTRVISDRFTTKKDVEWFATRLRDTITSELGAEVERQMPAEPYWVDFLRDAPEPTGEEGDDADLEAPKVYEMVASLDVLREKLLEYQILYNESVRGAKMDLVFFRDCLVHMVRVSRIIRTPQGNALLVGVGGSGKQSVTRLATSIARYSIFQIQLSRSYNANNLLEDIKALYLTAGLKGKGVTFVMTDNEIKSEGFLEYINNLLATGEIGGLFQRDEIDDICSQLIPVMKSEFPRRTPTNENLYDYFITRVRNNLHVVLCFSPVGEKFRSRALKFPAVFSGCTMDWFMTWPKDALIAVADHFLGNFDVKCSEDVKSGLVDSMGVVQDGVNTMCGDYFERYRRQTFVTPASYLSFLNAYRKLYTAKYNHVGELARRMNTGLDKLVEAGQSVGELSKELVVKEKELAVASKETEVVLKEVSESAAAAEKVKAEVQKVKDKAQAIVDAIDKDKVVAESKLAAAKPALEEAERALETIKPADIATVKKLGKPPHLIMRIMDVVLLLFGRRVDPVVPDPERPCATPSWKEALKTMNGPMLQELLSFNKDTITEEMCELMAPILEMEDYSFENAKRVCGNVAGLLSWTQAMSFFFTVNKEVLPLKANLAVAEAKLAVATKELNTAQAQLDEKQRELDIVQARFDAVMKKKMELEATANTCRRKMDAASALISGLGGEKERWTQQSKEFQSQIERLVGDVLLLCAFMSYSGPFNADFRMALLTNWKKELNAKSIPYTKTLNVTEELVDNATAGEWSLQGLPNDELSLQNGIIVTQATRFPLLIDPQGQGKGWIKNREAQNELQVTTLNNKYFRQHLEDALSLGRALLIEDVGEDLDPALDNVLDKNFIKSGSSYKVKVGDKEVDVMNGFKLYITTKLANPRYTPEVFARTSIIDFTVTMRGLEDQLLAKVILTEKAELETERVALLTEVTANKKKMKELEDNLLMRLTTTQGSLVDDESLITVLQVTKQTAEEVNEKLAIAADTEIKINTAREEYRPVATRGSILYFLIVEMGLVNVMYQISLDQFLGLFDVSMERSTKSPVPSKRIHNIIEYLTFEVFAYTARGLYEEHKFLFTLLLALKIELQAGRIKYSEFNTLIKGGASLDLNAVTPKPKPWILDTTWLNLVQLSELPQFAEILNQIQRNDKAWKAWFEEAEPENAVIPDGYNQLDVFRRLLLIRSWCPDRTIPQARRYIAATLGERYAESVILNMENLWESSDPRVPMIGLLSMGSDPTASIQHLAKQHKVECREVSMGQGQEVHARKLVQTFQQTGGWALLQNCHLGLDFLAELQDMVQNVESVHDSFRLWITTEVHPKFPINLLQCSIKFTNEPPQGIKAGLKRTYGGVTQEQLDINDTPQWKPMLYGVAFLHSVVQERRKYGPLGWNIPYEFNQGDLIASIQAVQNHLDDMDRKRGVGWPVVRYMLGEVHYGGRVTDDRDKRLLNTFCSTWFGENMFDDKFEFYKGYNIPVCKTIQDYRDLIEKMSPVDTPYVFGLHSNADITYQSAMARDTLGTIVDIQPKDSSAGAGESRESVVQRMCNEFLEKMPADFVPHEVRARLKKMGAVNSMNIFLRQEIDRMQRVMTMVRSTLSDLILAIDGTIIMSEVLRDALDNMFDARVPRAWAAISWNSATLGFWFTELLERHAQFYSWCFDGRPNAFWMTGFFNPQGFITAMRQEITRAHKGWALDSVVCANEVTKMASKEDCTSPPKEGVYVYGLSLDGAGFDKKNLVLVEQTPKVLYTPLPVVHIYAINSTGERDKRQYECPVYRKPRRTDLEYITMLDLRTNVNPNVWTLRGVALLCDTK
eukprot:m.302067 g.302067  ORF g.302067 m.302067 type:complete len:4524 (+) comp22998_c0_seq7:51-13622(+)